MKNTSSKKDKGQAYLPSYSFEKRNNPEPETLATNIKSFYTRFEIQEPHKLDKEDQFLIKTFCSVNLQNINWYSKRIKKERNLAILYNSITISLLIIIPLLVFFSTEISMRKSANAANVEESIQKPLKTEEGINSLEEAVLVEGKLKNNIAVLKGIGSFILVLLTSILALHKFISSWIEKRQFRSQFNRAQVGLKDILYALEADFKKVDIEFESDSENYLASAFVLALENSIKKSREIVNTETNLYFEKLANPSFDLGGALQSSAKLASSLFSSFKSKNWDITKLEAEQEKMLQDARAKKKIDTDLKTKMQKILLKIDVKNLKEERLSEQIRMEELKDTPNTETIKNLKAEFDTNETEIEALKIAYMELEIDKKQMNPA